MGFYFVFSFACFPLRDRYDLAPIRTLDRRVEVAWFSALCGDDYEYLGVHDDALRSSYEHCGEIVRRADRNGYQNILLPSGWIAGQDAPDLCGGHGTADASDQSARRLADG